MKFLSRAAAGTLLIFGLAIVTIYAWRQSFVPLKAVATVTILDAGRTCSILIQQRLPAKVMPCTEVGQAFEHEPKVRSGDHILIAAPEAVPDLAMKTLATQLSGFGYKTSSARLFYFSTRQRRNEGRQ
jgi:hypothetical protein